ncbi:hypothetical protein L6773_04710 [Rhodohalobacter sp. WB101]|uniref:DUF2269 family protein n=2 Tax=Rhodohalobacter sulfatireducens TaxID=2911366 RepID=A0ABS9KAJ7_9BACT|nr:hypothetical protein [Rhodohalobacter sulfatireducens]
MAYYIALGALLTSFGVYLLIKTGIVKDFLLSSAEEDQPPVLWRKVLKYFLLFTIPCLVLSFFPFSWVELFFSIWSLLIVFMLGQLLVMWPQTSQAIVKQKDELDKKIRFVAANLISIGIILFLLCYVLIERTSST